MIRLNRTITITGIGLHSGKECTVKLEPSEEPSVILSNGTGVYSLRTLKTDGTRRASDYIFPDGTRIRTCEHVFSALCGLGIFTHIRITVYGGEMPALDGCAKLLCGRISENSFDDGLKLSPLTLSEPLIVMNEDGTRYICAFPDDRFHVTCCVDYAYIGAQIYDYERGKTDYAKEISPARTFAMDSEIEYLRSHGMALGGSLDNALIIGEKVIAKGGLHWPDEVARHKVLDVIGDMYSVSVPLNCHITAVRAGHELHLKLAEKMKGAVKIA